MMTHSPGHKNRSWHYYICGRKDRHGAASCPSRRVGAINAEKYILASVLDRNLTPQYLAEAIQETKKQLDSTSEIELQIAFTQRKLEDLDIAIQRTLNTIEKTGSSAAQERLKEREAERTEARGELERLNLNLTVARTEITLEAIEVVLTAWRAQFDQVQELGNVREMKAWLLQFVSKIELGYNRARVFYTYPMIDLLADSHNARKTPALCGGTSL